MSASETTSEDRPLRVLFFDLNDPFDHLNWSGTPAQILRSLQAAGVSVAASGPHYLFVRKSINWILHRYYRYCKKLFYHIDRDLFWVRIFTAFANRRLYSDRDADAIVTAFPAFTSFLRTGLPIFMIHDATWGQVVESYPWFSRENQPERIVQGGFKLEQLAYRRRDVYPILTSQWAADRAVKDYGADPTHISILPFGPNLDSPPDKAVVEASLKNRGKGRCKLLFIGKEWTRKGGPAAIKTTASLIAMGVPAELHIVGPAELKAGTKAAEAFPDFVHSHGFLSKAVPEQASALKKLYLESDFFILPTQAEALGVVFAEATAHALPCLGTSVGGVPSVLHDGVGGAIFSPLDSVEEMASWIKLNYLDRSRYELLARRARQDYEVRLSSLAYGTRLAELIRSRVKANSQEHEISQSASGNRLVETT